jgi:hypothetical protein
MNPEETQASTNDNLAHLVTSTDVSSLLRSENSDF